MKLGQLYLAEGNWKGEQIISREWVQEVQPLNNKRQIKIKSIIDSMLEKSDILSFIKY
jgi:hypothetical protein